MGSLTSLVAGTLTTALFLSSSAFAFHDDDTPLLASGGGAGSGWASWRITTDGAKIVADIMKSGNTGASQAGAALYDAEGGFLGGFTFTAIPGKTGVYADLHPAEGVNVHHNGLVTSQGGLGLGLSINDPEFTPDPFVGTLQLVVWAAGDGGSWDWALRGDAGVTLDAQDGGDHAFVYTSEDFSGVANVQAYASSFGGRVNALTSVAETMENTLIGVYFNLITSRDAMTMTSPAGTALCPCFVFGIGDEGIGPGDYSFDLTGIGVGVLGLDEIILGGADARLPA